jgi:uncharacterized protein YbjT (DUF2867 family)
MRVLVTGATGYIGGRLVPRLLEAGHEVRCLVRAPGKLAGRPWREEIEVVAGDLMDPESVRAALEGVEAAYYLVHSMGHSEDFAEADLRAARTFRQAAADAGVGQIVYLGGLGEDDGRLSAHLRSRQEVGRVLAAGSVPVTELRAAIIIGSGSASFEMVRALAEVLPVMVTPKWVNRTRCQPIAIRDVLGYLIGVLGREEALGRVFEIGGPDVLTYREIMNVYAEVAGLRRRVIVSVPVLTPRLSSHWINLVTPLPMDLVRPLVDGLMNDVVVRDPAIREVVPLEPMGLREALADALERVQGLDVPTRWTGAGGRDRGPAEPAPFDPGWSGGTLLSDDRTLRSDASPEQVMRVLQGIGGTRGWLAADRLWALRGLLDKAVGGVGMRRGRRHPDELAVGETLDFWRVETLEPGRLLRLRAEMKMPGTAWLEWAVRPDGSGSEVRQRAILVPRGLFGRLYWYAVLPFHALIFRRLLNRVSEVASRATAAQSGEVTRTS